MSCNRCGGPTKPLFTGVYCVIGCDQKHLVESPEKPGRPERTTQCMHMHTMYHMTQDTHGFYNLKVICKDCHNTL